MSPATRSRPDLPELDFVGRRRRLATRVDDEGLAGAWVTDPADLAWLTGFTGSNGAVFVRADGEHVLATDARYEGRVPADGDLAAVIDRDLFAVVATAVDGGLGPVAFDPGAVTHARALTWLDRTDGRLVRRAELVTDLRRIKDPGEIARLALACALTVATWQEVVVAAGDGLVGRTEREVATRIERTMVDLGADDVGFPSIVAAGPNGAVPHHEPTDRPIAAGDLLTTDIGARVDGYHADFTRTVAIGRVPDDMVAVHGLVEQAQAAGVDAARVGEPVVDVDTVTRAVITHGGRGDAFVHGVGHGIGLEVHEDPIIALATTDRLSAGMVLTVEPGIYLPGRGGVRIEDSLVVTEDGPRVLTDAPTGLHPTTPTRVPT